MAYWNHVMSFALMYGVSYAYVIGLPGEPQLGQVPGNAKAVPVVVVFAAERQVPSANG